MTSLSDDDVRHIAKLARLVLSEEEVKKFSGELSSILEYIEILKEVDTTNVEPTSLVTGMQNSFRDDDVCESDVTTEELLDCSPLPIKDHMIETPSAHG